MTPLKSEEPLVRRDAFRSVTIQGAAGSQMLLSLVSEV